MKIIKFFSVLIVFIFLTHCGPKIIYYYQPPQSAEGKVCAAQCLVSKSQCRQLVAARNDNCEYRRKIELEQYRRCKKHKKGRCYYPSMCFGGSSSSCNEDYRECYQACGGKVQAEVIQK